MSRTSTAAWRRFRAARKAEWEAEARPCAICGKPIDYTLSGALPLGLIVGHIVSVSEDPSREYDRDNVRPEHRRCGLSQAANGEDGSRAAYQERRRIADALYAERYGEPVNRRGFGAILAERARAVVAAPVEATRTLVAVGFSPIRTASHRSTCEAPAVCLGSRCW